MRTVRPWCIYSVWRWRRICDMVHEIICPPVQEIEPQLRVPGPPPSLSLNRNDHFDHFYFSENEREWQR
jgi:hypothetical protein